LINPNPNCDIQTKKHPQQDASLGEKGGKLERKGEKERESFTEILFFLERFSPHVESQYIFYRALSLQTRDSLFSTFSLFLSPSPVSLYLRCLAGTRGLETRCNTLRDSRSRDLV
jgi:hypothetical protein